MMRNQLCKSVERGGKVFEAEGQMKVKTLVWGKRLCLWNLREGGAGHSEPEKLPGTFPGLRHQEARDKWTDLN